MRWWGILNYNFTDFTHITILLVQLFDMVVVSVFVDFTTNMWELYYVEMIFWI